MSVAVIFKAPYKKGGGAGGNAGYVAKRFGVDKSINNVVSLNANYIATRPMVEKLGTHGLFSNYENVNLSKVIEKINNYEGNVWMPIISLKREDAARLGYDNARAWQILLKSMQPEIAKHFKIPLTDLEWYAAFHDKDDHPHVHMLVYSKSGGGYLSKKGIYEIRKALTKEIFKNDLYQLYDYKTQIFNMAYDGIGKRKIAKLLYQEKVPTPSVYARDKGSNWCFPFRDTYKNDYIWSDVSVGEILKNEVYIGNMVHGKSKKASHKSKKILKVPEGEWIRVENTHEPIIEKDIWHAVQQKISIRKRPTAEKTTQIFAGLLKCADCGRTMGYARKKDSNYAYFNCRTYRDKGTDFCTSHRINYKAVYSLVLADIQRHTKTLKLSESKLYDAALSFNKEQCLKETKARREQVKKMEKRIHELDFIIKKTYENNLIGKISDERFAILSSDYEKEQAELKAKQDELQNKLDEYVEHDQNANKFVELIKRYTDITELDAKTLNELIDRIEVGQKYKDENGQQRQDLTVYYKFCGNIKY